MVLYTIVEILKSIVIREKFTPVMASIDLLALKQIFAADSLMPF